MRIVDSHVHLYPPEVNKAPKEWAARHGEKHWALLCTRLRKNGRPVQAFPEVEELLRDMDAAGIERVVLQGWYWEKHDTCVQQNRFFEACLAAHPDRLSAFATIHPAGGEDAVVREVRWAHENGFCGLGELSPHSQGGAMPDYLWGVVWALAGELNLPVNLHVTESESPDFPGKVATPLKDFLRWAGEHPGTNFILAHWGARLPLDPEFGAAARKCQNLYYDSAASPLIYGPGIFRDMFDAAGAGHVLYGSDHPLNLYPKAGADPHLGDMGREFSASRLNAAELQAVASENAVRLLKLP